MKLIIQIPCYNEEVALPVTLSQLPKHIDGIDEIDIPSKICVLSGVTYC